MAARYERLETEEPAPAGAPPPPKPLEVEVRVEAGVRPKAPASSLSYRPEIDGLRAFAVLPVVIYHLFEVFEEGRVKTHSSQRWERSGAPLTFPGGFAGVDVFFVISGFLITGLQLAQLRERGAFSLPRFWGRRVRRLVPAMLAMVAATLLYGNAVFFGGRGSEFTELAEQAAFVLASAGNFFFMARTDSYFARPRRFPLLHCWSLAVEEQYYVVFPLAISLIFALCRPPAPTQEQQKQQH